MPNLSQTFVVNAPLETCWTFLSDAERTFRCFPGCDDVKRVGADSFALKVSVKVGFIAPTFQVQLNVTERDSPHRFVARASGKDNKSGSSVNMTNTIELLPLGPDRTEVRFNAQVSLFGALGNFGWGIMEKKAREMGELFSNRVKSELEKSPV